MVIRPGRHQATGGRTAAPYIPEVQAAIDHATLADPSQPCLVELFMSLQPSQPTRLTRVQQLSLNTWRRAAATLDRVLAPHAVLEHAALHAVLASLRDLDQPLLLFARHASAYPEFALITSLVPAEGNAALVYDILDTAFLLRWNELVADGRGPQELPPLGTPDGTRRWT